MRTLNVSVIIPTYGRDTFLAESLASVAEQSQPPSEVIVVDDCSQPPVVVPNLGLHIKVVRHARNMGPGAARNTGLAHATSELVIFLDDDDLLTPRRLQLATQELGDARAHCAAVELLHETGHKEHYKKYFEGDMRGWFNHVPHPAMGQVVHRREDLLQFDPTLRVSEDTEWWIRMADSAVFAWSPEVGLRVRRHPERREGVDRGLRCRTRQMILRRHRDELDRRSRARIRGEIAAAALLAGERLTGARWAGASILTHPSKLNAKRLARSLVGIQ